MRFKRTFVNSVGKIVKEVLIGLDMYTEEAFGLVMRTGAVETGYRALEQQPRGPGLGFWQVESGPPDRDPLLTAEDIWFNYAVFRGNLRERIQNITDIEKGPWTRSQILRNIALQVVLCRLKYRRDPNPIPKGLEEQAAYWKRIYNPTGKGTVKKFVEAAGRMEV